ncbi:fimbria/pilus outer membrane usher protein [Paraburkholderia dinghuensis]|nr:fimbria/pilus outer membrane usher protein [Paraburkholderia dinghuensis]
MSAAIMMAIAASASHSAWADVMVSQVQFDDLMLMKPKGGSIDVSRFGRGEVVMPGRYNVEMYRNGDWIGHLNVQFVAQQPGANATPCFDRALISRIGLNMAAFGEEQHDALAALDAGECIALDKLVPDATSSFDLSDFRLDLSIPQIALARNPSGYVSPELWDSGVTSATLAYNFNTFHSEGSGSRYDQSYLGLTSGINVGDWHFRSNGAFTSGTGAGTHYQDISTYVQRDLPSLRSQLTIGDSFTDGAMFDSIGVRGIQIGTNDQMLPDSMRGYAPVIRGIAMTNARVTVTQNGNRIYETNVAPGAFSIDDVYAVGYGGNLVVTVTEADGSQHSFTVPYSSVVQLLRPGISRFHFVVGQVRDVQLNDHPNFFQATYQRGINNLLTGYAGVNAARGYTAGLVGAAFNTPVGALALDLTYANATIPGVTNTRGQSLRISYSRMLPATGTDIAVAAYRYSSSGFWTMRDALLARQAIGYGPIGDTFYRQRNQLQVTLNQSLGTTWGNVYVVGSTQNYWNRSGTDTQVQVGYNNSLRLGSYNVGYNLSFARQRDATTGRIVTQALGTVTLPLGRSTHSPVLSLNIGQSSQSGASDQAMLTGTAGEHNQFAYGVTASHMSGVDSGGGNIQYRGVNSTLTASASTGTRYTQVGAGLSGGVVVHPGGMSLANSLSDTIGVVEAKGAQGASIENWPGVKVDNHGYAILPFLNPYHMNQVNVDPKGLPFDVEFSETSMQVAPRQNAVAMIRFGTKVGSSVLLTVRRKDGTLAPFGADVSDKAGTIIGTIGQGGHAFLRGLQDGGEYSVRWGAEPGDVCSYRYVLDKNADRKKPYEEVSVSCGPSAATLSDIQHPEMADPHAQGVAP